METYKHVLGATDFSELGDRAVARAVALAVKSGAKLTLAHVVPSGDGHPLDPSYVVTEHAERRDEARRAAKKALGERLPDALPKESVAVDVRIGDPAETLIAMVKEHQADLVVLATNGRRGLRRLLLGSVTERVVRESPALQADVLVVT